MFGPTVLILSLLSPCVLEFTDPPREWSYPLVLEPRSLLVMQGDARFKYKHAISKLEAETGYTFTTGESITIDRARRVSLTMRWLV
jgi:alkylated DNA repair dioxygenase AlkB